MKKNIEFTVCAKGLAVLLTFGIIVLSLPAEAARVKKPTLSTTSVTVEKGKTKKLTVKNAKSVDWKLSKSAAKIVSLSGKSKKGATIRGLKKGSASIFVSMKVEKKTYNKSIKIKVTEKKRATPTSKPTVTPSVAVTATATAEPTIAPTKKPAPDTVVISSDNVCAVNYGVRKISYSEGGVTFTSIGEGLGGGIYFWLNARSCIDLSQYDAIEIEAFSTTSDAPVVCELTQTIDIDSWGGNPKLFYDSNPDQDPDGDNAYATLTTENKKYTFKLADNPEGTVAYAVCLKYNAWHAEGQNNLPNCTFTIKSIKLVKKEDTIDYTSILLI